MPPHGRRHAMDVKLREETDGPRLRALIDAERDAVQRDRRRAALLAAEGHKAVAIAATLGRSRRFVQAWAYRYRDGGVDAVRPQGKSPGRPPQLPRAPRAPFKPRVRAGPAAAAGGVCVLRGEGSRRILEREFGVAYTL